MAPGGVLYGHMNAVGAGAKQPKLSVEQIFFARNGSGSDRRWSGRLARLKKNRLQEHVRHTVQTCANIDLRRPGENTGWTYNHPNGAGARLALKENIRTPDVTLRPRKYPKPA